jgi:hypothetical protein
VSNKSAAEELQQYLRNGGDVEILTEYTAVGGEAAEQRRQMEPAPANELDLQQAFIDELLLHVWQYPDIAQIHAIPNQICPSRRPAPAQRAGMPDHCLPVPVDPFHGLYLEAKMPGKKPNQTQLDVHADLRRSGYAVQVWDDVDTAVSVVLQSLAGEYPPF